MKHNSQAPAAGQPSQRCPHNSERHRVPSDTAQQSSDSPDARHGHAQSPAAQASQPCASAPGIPPAAACVPPAPCTSGNQARFHQSRTPWDEPQALLFPLNRPLPPRRKYPQCSLGDIRPPHKHAGNPPHKKPLSGWIPGHSQGSAPALHHGLAANPAVRHDQRQNGCHHSERVYQKAIILSPFQIQGQSSQASRLYGPPAVRQ